MASRGEEGGGVAGGGRREGARRKGRAEGAEAGRRLDPTARGRARGVWSLASADGSTESLFGAGAIDVRERDESTLVARVPVSPAGALEITLAEDRLTAELLDCPRSAALQLELELPRGTPGTSLNLADDGLNYIHNGFHYCVTVEGAVAGWERRVVCRAPGSRLTLHLGEKES